MQFIKTRDVKDPVRNPEENAGIDFFIPEYCFTFKRDLLAKNPKFIATNKPFFAKLFRKSFIHTRTGVIYIAPHDDVIIPSGIRSKFSKDLALIANNKSGIATKKKLIFGASVIDTSYQGEWHCHMISCSKRYQQLRCGDKVVQFIPHVISTEQIEVLDMSVDEFFTEKTSRGEGWQGSTGLSS